MIDGSVQCPYCGEAIEIEIDEGGGMVQEYVEDCQVCCRPMRVTVAGDEEGEPVISVGRIDD